MEHIFFDRLPFPPTSNKIYIVYMSQGKVRHGASQVLREFKRDFYHYEKCHALLCLQNRNLAQEWVKKNFVLHIHTEFFFEKSRIFTKDGRIKKIDLSNRLKAIHDLVSTLLRIDDSIFFNLSATKKEAKPGEQEHASIHIHPFISAVNSGLHAATSAS